MSDRQGQGGPDLMLGLWTSWMKAATDLLAEPGTPAAPWRQAAPGPDGGDGLPAARRDAADRSAAALDRPDVERQPAPRSRAARLGGDRPARCAPSGCARWPIPRAACRRLAELNAKAWQIGDRDWSEAGQRWWGLAATGAGRPGATDKRFAAPEWHANPVYRHAQGPVPAGLGLAAASRRPRRRTSSRPSGSGSTSTCGSSSTR